MRTCQTCTASVTGRKKFCDDCIKERVRAAGRRYRKEGPKNPQMARRNKRDAKRNCTQCGIMYGMGNTLSVKAPRFDKCLGCALAEVDSKNQKMMEAI